MTILHYVVIIFLRKHACTPLIQNKPFCIINLLTMHMFTVTLKHVHKCCLQIKIMKKKLIMKMLSVRGESFLPSLKGLLYRPREKHY